MTETTIPLEELVDVLEERAACVSCGCTDEAACEGGCSWVEPGVLCDRCVPFCAVCGTAGRFVAPGETCCSSS